MPLSPTAQKLRDALTAMGVSGDTQLTGPVPKAPTALPAGGEYGAAGRGENPENAAYYEASAKLGIPASAADSVTKTKAGRDLVTQIQTRNMGGAAPQAVVPVASKTSNASRYSAASGTRGLTTTSSGGIYGSAGRDTLGTKVTGNTGVDRTAGIPNSPLDEYMSFLSPQSVLDRQRTARRELERERQGQLDAIRTKYASQVATEQQAGAEDLARQRSMNLRAGLGGSDFGAANKIEVRDRTAKNVRAIEANQDIEIADAMNQIEQLAQSRFEQQQSALQSGFSNMFQVEQYNQGLAKEQRAQAVESIAQLGKAGLDLPTIKERDPQLYESLTAASGMGDLELEAVLNNSKPPAQKVDYKYETFGNRIVAYGVDPNTGELKKIEQQLDFDVPQNMKPTFAPDGTMMLVPDQFDPSIPANEQITVVGSFAKPEKNTVTAKGGLVGADGKPLKLTATQTDAISGFENTLQASQEALNVLASGVSTGPVAGRAMGVGKFFGSVDEGQLKLEQLLGKIKADFMKAMSGAAVSEQEVKRLSKFLPDMNDQENVIESKLTTLIQETSRSKQNLLNTLGASTPSTGEVEVRAPNGAVGTIPASQLQDALAEGYTQL